uniref:Uncharacterized protein n=1 Tax=Micrurus paraensis TaxID=1970185 RepID=A0A2D4K7I4_9SAUR
MGRFMTSQNGLAASEWESLQIRIEFLITSLLDQEALEDVRELLQTVARLLLQNSRTSSIVSSKGIPGRCQTGTFSAPPNPQPLGIHRRLLPLLQKSIVASRRAIRSRNGGKKCDAPFSAKDLTEWEGNLPGFSSGSKRAVLTIENKYS